MPIAIGILAASGQVAPEKLAEYEFAGELALSGLLRPVRGALAMAWQGMQAKRAFVLPEENAGQAAVMRGITVYGARSLGEVAAHLNGIEPLAQTECQVPQMPFEHGGQPDLCDVKGQHTARLALEIAAAGGHSLLMMGPPGTGKSMLSQRLPGILPPLTEDELVEVWALRSLLPNHQQQLDSHRPFRSPHHSASAAAMVGGGSDPRPGEISLAHHGVLFLDELPEFDRKVLEVLREPLENGEIHISRAARQAVYPAKFQLVAAMNPCPCGYLGHLVKPCRCTPESVARYRSKISGPLLDRIDLTIEVPSLSAAELMQQEAGESSASVLERVIAARDKQYARQGKVNAALSVSELDTSARIQKEAQEALGGLLEKLSLSARSFHRIMRVARTLADLAGDEEVGRSHVMKAIGFRRAL
ncbi:Competence protein ComM [Neisseria meningitidis]|nr:Competence protein ComM [Neisseria meningitidis]CKK71529.1 Competence protein ComM [Neisseria meningitidis]